MAGEEEALIEEVFVIREAEVFSVHSDVVEHLFTSKVSIVHVSYESEVSFLVCESLFIPLVNQPVLKSDSRLYLLPDSEGKTFVVHIADTIPPRIIQAFEVLLAQFTEFKDVSVEKKVGTSPSGKKPVRVVTPSKERLVVELNGDSAVSISKIKSPRPGSTASMIQTPVPSTTIDKSGRKVIVMESGDDATSKVAASIIIAGHLTSTGIVKGADLVGRGFQKISSSAATLLGKAEKDTKVDDKTLRNIDRMGKVSKVAAAVTSSAVASAASIAKSVGTSVTAAIKDTEYGKKIQESAETDAGRAARQLAASSVIAFAEIWEGLDTGARIFGRHLSSGTTSFVEHRYGDEAKKAVHKSLDAAGNLGEVALNLRQLSIGGLVKMAGYETARNIVLSEEEEKQARAKSQLSKKLLKQLADRYQSPDSKKKSHSSAPSIGDTLTASTAMALASAASAAIHASDTKPADIEEILDEGEEFNIDKRLNVMTSLARCLDVVSNVSSDSSKEETDVVSTLANSVGLLTLTGDVQAEAIETKPVISTSEVITLQEEVEQDEDEVDVDSASMKPSVPPHSSSAAALPEKQSVKVSKIPIVVERRTFGIKLRPTGIDLSK